MALSIHAKIGIGWICSAAIGIVALSLARKRVHDKRYDSMKAKQRIRDSNIVD